MPAIDASIPLGIKPPDQMQQLSGLLNVARGAQAMQIGNQTLQQNQQATQQGAIDLQERQAGQQVLSDPSNYTDDQGNFDMQKAQKTILPVMPTTGHKVIAGIAIAHQQATQAQDFLGKLTDENRTRVGQTLYSTLDAPPDVVGKALDAIGEQYKNVGGQQVAQNTKAHYQQVLAAQGPDAAKQFLAQTAKSVLPPVAQQTLETPDGPTVDNGAVTYGINTKPNVPGLPVGGVIPGTSVQKTVPPTQGVVGPNNQPGVLGPHGVPPKAGTVPSGYNGGSALAAAPEQLAIMQQERDKAVAQGDSATVAALDREMGRIRAQPGFVATGPVPGANESKSGSVQVVNDHWGKINAGAADAPVAQALLSTIKQLAPGAITGTESGKRSYWNGLFNALHIGDKATGDLQKDTDLLNKAMAQLNLATPATTDAMRTLVEAGRPHSTMSEGAIKDAASQIEGQLKANMATRNLLAPDKKYADATGDLTHYQQKLETIQKAMDPRIFQYESMTKDDRKAFMAKLAPQDRAALIGKTKQLEALGVFQ